MLSLGLSSCDGSYFSRTNHLYGHDYRSFDSSESQRFTETEGQIITIHYEATVTQGVLAFILRDATAAELWRVDLQADGSDSTTVVAPNSGNYTMLVVGEATGGNYDIAWEMR